MENQSYYNIPAHDNIRVTDRPLAVNCAGVLNTHDHIVQEHFRVDYYLMYIWDGAMDLFYEGKKLRLTPGRFIIYEPDRKIKYINNKGSSLVYLWLHFTGYDAQSLLELSGVTPGIIHEIGLHNEFIMHFQRLSREFMIYDKSFNGASVAILTEIVILLGRLLRNNKQSPRPLASVEYIHKNYSKELDVDALAALEHLSPTHYRTIFKKNTAMSPNEYIIKHRLQVACRLLCDSFRSVTDIAHSVGYDDPLYFSRIFKKKIGISPKQYRLQILGG